MSGERRGRWHLLVAARDRGAVTAEFAVALPAIVLVLGVCVGALQAAALQVRLQDLAALAARAEGRGDPLSALAGLAPSAELSTWREGPLVCARAERLLHVAPALPAMRLGAEACALADGR